MTKEEIFAGYYWTHDSLRLDVKRFEWLANNINSLSKEDAQTAMAYWPLHKKLLDHHSYGEDILWFPEIKKMPAFAERMAELEIQHKDLEEKERRVHDFVTQHQSVDPTSVNQEVFSATITPYGIAMREHLQFEQVVVGDWINEVPLERIEALHKYFIRKIVSKKDIIDLAPWFASAMKPGEESQIFKLAMPSFLKHPYKLFWKKSFAKKIAPFQVQA